MNAIVRYQVVCIFNSKIPFTFRKWERDWYFYFLRHRRNDTNWKSTFECIADSITAVVVAEEQEFIRMQSQDGQSVCDSCTICVVNVLAFVLINVEQWFLNDESFETEYPNAKIIKCVTYSCAVHMITWLLTSEILIVPFVMWTII